MHPKMELAFSFGHDLTYGSNNPLALVDPQASRSIASEPELSVRLWQ